MPDIHGCNHSSFAKRSEQISGKGGKQQKKQEEERKKMEKEKRN